MSDENKEPEEVIEVDPVEETKAPAVIVNFDKSGNYIVNDHLELRNAASHAIQSKLAPSHLADVGTLAVCAALTACRQFGLPDKSIAKMAVIKGSLCFYGSLYTAVAQKHPQWGKMKIIKLDDNCEEIHSKNKNLSADIWAVAIQIQKKGEKHWNEYAFTKKDAKQAGLFPANKDSSPWKKYTADMLFHKAKKRAFDAEYAGALEGVEYYEDVAEVLQMKDVTPAGQKQETKNAMNDLEAELTA